MLNTNTMDAIAPYVEHNNGRKLTPIPGSVLSTLTQGMIDKYQVLASVKHDSASVDDLSVDDIIQTITAGNEDTNSTEQCGRQVLNEAVNGIAKTMKNNILLTRGTVLPLIDKYTERLTTAVSEKCNRSVLALNIVEDKKFAILASPQLKSIVSDQKQRTRYNDIDLVRYHNPSLAIPDLLDLMKTNNTTFDEIISAWISVNGFENKVKEIYADVFVGNNVRTPQVVEGLFVRYINPDQYESAIIALLLCWGLVKNVQEGISLSLSDYKTNMEIFSSACCGVISQSISRYERSVASKNLVLQYPASNRQFCYDETEKNIIVVNGETYAHFLEMGGTPEMVFGSYLTDRSLRMGDILEKAKENLKEYEKQVSRGKLTSINNTLTIVQTELRDIAFDIVKTIAEQDTDTVNDYEPSYRIKFTGNEHMHKAGEFINRVNARHLNDYYATVRNFVCQCFFEGSMVLDLLNRIDALDPAGEKDINELALVSTVDLIVDWLINQIERDTKNVSLEGYYIK